MKKLIPWSILLACLTGCTLLTSCMMPNIGRLIPENKESHIQLFSPIYGWGVIDTRIPGSTNPLPPLPVPVIPVLPK